VQGAMMPLGDIRHTAPEEPLIGVLERMQMDDVNQMPVVSDGRIVGLVTRDSILRIIQTRMELAGLN
jgi:CBS domain-containing protein